MSENKLVKGYKVFNPDWTCKGFQYKVGESYEMDEQPIACERGFHFCEKLADCFNCYKFNKENKVAEVTAYGDIVAEETKCCTNKIKIEKEISWNDVLSMVNVGINNTGSWNTGNKNTGNRNIGNRNIGDWNTGSWNVGNENTGSWNAGNGNTGSWNAGNRNTGSWNVGNRNTGDWNIGNWNNGCFNTIQTKIFLFNKLSDWTIEDWIKSNGRQILIYNISVFPIRWIDKSNMTDDEKETHPEYEITGGYLKKLTQKEIFQEQQENWNQLSQVEKDIVMLIPNFDKEIFKQITGIDVDKE